MADLAASDVAYTLLRKRKINGSPSRYLINMKIVFGDGSKKYLTGGIPLDRGKLGCAVVAESIVISEAMGGDGIVYKVVSDQMSVASGSQTQPLIRMYQGDNNNAADAPLVEFVGSTDTVANNTTLYLEVLGY